MPRLFPECLLTDFYLSSGSLHGRLRHRRPVAALSDAAAFKPRRRCRQAKQEPHQDEQPSGRFRIVSIRFVFVFRKLSLNVRQFEPSLVS